jgi:glycine cleavage system H protein
METPADLKYTADHLWAKVEADGTVTAGITAHAQDELGDIVYVQAPEAGSRVTQGEACGVVESVKTAADLHAPVSGEVIAANGVIADHPERINTDPYGTWIFRLKPQRPAEVDALLDAAAYAQLVKGAS